MRSVLLRELIKGAAANEGTDRGRVRVLQVKEEDGLRVRIARWPARFGSTDKGQPRRSSGAPMECVNSSGSTIRRSEPLGFG